MSSWVAKDNWWGKTPSHSTYATTGINRSPRVIDGGYTHVHSHHHLHSPSLGYHDHLEYLHSPSIVSAPPMAREYIADPVYTAGYAPSPAFVEPALAPPSYVERIVAEPVVMEPPHLSPRYIEAPPPLASPVAAPPRVVMERVVRGREVAEAVFSQHNRVLQAARHADQPEPQQRTVTQAPVRMIRAHREEAPSRLGQVALTTPRAQMGDYIQDRDSGMVVREVGPSIRLGRAPIEWREPEAHVVLVGEEKKKKKKKKKHKKQSSSDSEEVPIRTTEQSLWQQEEEKRQLLLATADEAARAGEHEYYEGGATDYSGSQGKERDSPLSEQTREVMQQLEEQDLAAMQMQSEIVQLQGVVGDRMRAMGLEDELRDSGNQLVIEEEEEDEERGSGSFPDASSRSSQEDQGTPEQF